MVVLWVPHRLLPVGADESFKVLLPRVKLASAAAQIEAQKFPEAERVVLRDEQNEFLLLWESTELGLVWKLDGEGLQGVPRVCQTPNHMNISGYSHNQSIIAPTCMH